MRGNYSTQKEIDAAKLHQTCYMRIEVRSRNIKITPAIHQLIEKKAAKIALFLPEDTTVHFTIDVTSARHKIEATVVLNGTTIRAEQRSDDLYKTIDQTVDVLIRRIKTYKDKRAERYKGKETIRKAPADIPEVKLSSIVRRKEFSLSVMTAEDACAEMELLGHSFYVFLDAESDSDRACVVYKREDGGYGMLVPMN